MKTKEFNKVKPYTYLIIRKSDNKKYHGVRWANKVSPINDFAVVYFGSSKGDQSFCEEFKNNKGNFLFRICWTFDSIEEARAYETKINKKIYKRSDWINKNAFPAILLDEISRKKISCSKKGKSFSSDKHKNAVIKSNKTRILSPEFYVKCSKINKGKKFPKEFGEKISKSRKGLKLTETHKKNIGLGVKGEKNGMFRKTHSAHARKKISISKLGKPSWNKGLKFKKRKINGKEMHIYA